MGKATICTPRCRCSAKESRSCVISLRWECHVVLCCQWNIWSVLILCSNVRRWTVMKLVYTISALRKLHNSWTVVFTSRFTFWACLEEFPLKMYNLGTLFAGISIMTSVYFRFFLSFGPNFQPIGPFCGTMALSFGSVLLVCADQRFNTLSEYDRDSYLHILGGNGGLHIVHAYADLLCLRTGNQELGRSLFIENCHWDEKKKKNFYNYLFKNQTNSEFFYFLACFYISSTSVSLMCLFSYKWWNKSVSVFCTFCTCSGSTQSSTEMTTWWQYLTTKGTKERLSHYWGLFVYSPVCFKTKHVCYAVRTILSALKMSKDFLRAQTWCRDKHFNTDMWSAVQDK